MDLLSIAKILAPLAPVAASIAGGVVAGPAGAAIAGKFASLIMGKFGLPADASPGQLSDAVATAGEETARAKINAAMEQARAEIQGFVDVERAVLEAQVKNLSDVNATMRAEAAVPPEMREHWFFRAWRPAFAWGVLAIYVPFGFVLAYTACRSAYLSSEPLKSLNDAWQLLVGFFAVGLAVVGVLIPSRSIEKKAAIENAVPMPNAKPTPPSAPDSKPAIPAKPPAKPGMPPPVLGRD